MTPCTSPLLSFPPLSSREALSSRGAYITLEGINGSGKSSLLRGISAQLTSLKVPHLTTSEPGGTSLGKTVRTLLLEKSQPCSALTEVMLFAADRAQLMEEIIIPSLRKGIHVISDRSFFSSLAFQGFGRNIPLEKVVAINRLALQDHFPDATLFLDLSLREAESRLKKRQSSDKDAFEFEPDSFQQRVFDGFHKLYNSNRSTWHLIDATCKEAEVIDNAINIIKQVIDPSS